MRAGVLAAVVACALAASTARAAERPYCLEPGDGAASITFRAPDGARLHGVVLGRGRLGVVLGHQVGSSACEWYAVARTLAATGYRVLAIDHRAHGLSPVPPRPLSTTALHLDVGGAAAELRRRGSSRVVAIGSSMGGTAAVVAAANRKLRVDGVVSLSGAGVFQGLDARAAAKRLAVPARFLAARQDGLFPSDARAMMRASPSRDKAILLLPSGAHGTSLLERPDTGPRARAFVLDFLRRVAARA